MQRDQTLSAEPDEHRLAFLKGFLRRPADVGSVIPSSRFLERRIIRFAELDTAQCVVELGPGTGGTTRAFLARMKPDSNLLGVELDPQFCTIVRRINDRRLIVHQGSAEDLPAMIEHHRIPPPQVVISGIPFSTMPREVGERIITSVRDTLLPGGLFVAYQFRAVVADIARPILGEPEVSPEFINIPPMRVFRWRMPQP
jgi:phosphatidylethanolamine/phosphatidyl-N-methylethanolamine N-methyltransferase